MSFTIVKIEKCRVTAKEWLIEHIDDLGLKPIELIEANTLYIQNQLFSN